MKTLVLGLGNPILSDDGVGIMVAREIKKRVKGVDVQEASAAGFRIVDQIVGYDRLILIDAVQTRESEVGSLHLYKPEDFQETKHSTSTHDIGFFQALDIYKREGERVPEEIKIYGIEVEQTDVFSEKFTPKVKNALPAIVNQIIKENFS
ncbi:MAG: hydrogenase maturation protease [Candidatus Cloacimonetes bacterium]|nr:hydrogenase maturation protease [Candidatus Cloacimonadota bacterium]MBS3767259.1 hydrogenase maturation protease [Candidatus Cloacimonadota bacterium]